MTDMVCQGLNGFEIGDRRIVVQRAGKPGNTTSSSGANSMPLGAAGPMALPSIIPQDLLGQGAGDPTTIVFLLNMVTPEELTDDQEYEGGRLVSAHLNFASLMRHKNHRNHGRHHLRSR